VRGAAGRPRAVKGPCAAGCGEELGLDFVGGGTGFRGMPRPASAITGQACGRALYSPAAGPSSHTGKPRSGDQAEGGLGTIGGDTSCSAAPKPARRETNGRGRGQRRLRSRRTAGGRAGARETWTRLSWTRSMPFARSSASSLHSALRGGRGRWLIDFTRRGRPREDGPIFDMGGISPMAAPSMGSRPSTTPLPTRRRADLGPRNSVQNGSVACAETTDSVSSGMEERMGAVARSSPSYGRGGAPGAEDGEAHSARSSVETDDTTGFPPRAGSSRLRQGAAASPKQPARASRPRSAEEGEG